MKNIEVDDELYQYIASNTQSIGESASQILRRLLNLGPALAPVAKSSERLEIIQPAEPTTVVNEQKKRNCHHGVKTSC